MRLLICSLEPPTSPLNGLRLYVSALFRELGRDHHVRLLTFEAPGWSPGGTGEGVRAVPPPRRGLLGGSRAAAGAVVRGRPWRAGELARSMRGPLADELDAFRPDVVQVTPGRLAGLAGALRGRPAVLAALDAWHLNVEAEAALATGLRRRLLLGEAGRVRRHEATLYRPYGRVVVVSREDGQALTDLDPSIRVAVIPNGVDAEAFHPPNRAVEPDRIVFTGVMSYGPNVVAADFLARRVLPLVRRTHPGARLSIVGRRPDRRVQALAALDGVEVVGEVPDMAPWLGRGRAYACPMLSGSGIKNKLLEAMAAGLPCVATPLALQGLDVRHGREVLVGQREEELAGHLVRLLEDDNLARDLGEAARAYVRAEHSWTKAAERHVRVYQEVLAGRPAIR